MYTKNIAMAAVTVFLLLSSCASSHDTQQETVPSTILPPTPMPATPLYWNGDGGKAIKLAVLEPSGKGLSGTEQWMLSMVQSSITGDFQKYSAMTIVDRQNLEKILGEQKQSLSGDYSDEDYINIGRLTNAQYILAGSITKTASVYMLDLAITDAESGERKASYPPKAVSPFALENMSAIKEATTELLKQLGVNLTERGLQELRTIANTASVQAETALAKGIIAQQQGTIVEALSYFIQATNYDSRLAEAANRMNVLAANISSGNIGEDTRNDIAWRREWITRLQETENFFANTLKEPQPYYIVYSTNIQRGNINYEKETIDLSVWVGFFPDYAWATQINEIINTVKKGLQETKRSQIWGLNWPVKTISTLSPFVDQTKNSTSTVVVEIINDEGKSIGKQTVRAPYGFEIENVVVAPLWQWEGDVSFPAVDANLITNKLTIHITSIDGVAAEDAARQKKISVMPQAEWEAMLRINPTAKRNIEEAREQQRASYLLIANYTHMLQRDPQNISAYLIRGKIYLDKHDYYQAIADYTQAIKLNPNNTRAYFYRGFAYRNTGDIRRAIADYETAVRLDPNNILFRNNLRAVRGY